MHQGRFVVLSGPSVPSVSDVDASLARREAALPKGVAVGTAGQARSRVRATLTGASKLADLAGGFVFRHLFLF